MAYQKKWEGESTTVGDSRVTDIDYNNASSVPAGSSQPVMTKWQQLWCTKSFAGLVAESQADSGLKRVLSGLDLMLIGIGAIIGTGIFVLAGVAAGKYAGPAVVISFLIGGIASALAGLCYTEMATMIPISGSAYTFAYATLGELVAWVIGWTLLLEYMIGSAAVAVGWSAYFSKFFKAAFGVTFDHRFCSAPITWDAKTSSFVTTGNYVDLPAAMICTIVTIVLVVGIKESAWVNHIIVAIKGSAVLTVIIWGFTKVDPDNYTPFMPPNEGGDVYGFAGVMRAAVVVFFAYIGFDAVTCMAQEAKVPQRDLPIGVLGSLGVCTVLYILMSTVLVGVISYTEFAKSASPMALVADAIGGKGLVIYVTLAAMCGLTSVLLVMQMGQPRIFYSMAKDGLLPQVCAKIHPRFGTPHVTTIISGVFIALASAVLPIDVLADMSSIGTLFAFVLVSLGVIVLRFTQPDAQRLFRVFGNIPINRNGVRYEFPIVPVLSMAMCIWLMSSTGVETLYRFLVWLAVGLIVYFSYGLWHSKMRFGITEITKELAH
eukprot:comp24306_c2_seq2/m.45660 comp24306_c2_seq2/g.45660  ORF comp24306_c2_seq2/g.45660 comp24306_c2_seq2/m.45660 type:complete len:545 (-) comp24306_c2_seq2:282-1916(-)